MLLTKVNSHYEFQSPSIDGAFLVKLILNDKQEEKLVTRLVSVPTFFAPRNLEPGTIRKVIGEEGWQQFLRMKEQGTESLLIDPQNLSGTGVTSRKMTS
jgi:hypothetical protein